MQNENLKSDYEIDCIDLFNKLSTSECVVSVNKYPANPLTLRDSIRDYRMILTLLDDSPNQLVSIAQRNSVINTCVNNIDRNVTDVMIKRRLNDPCESSVLFPGYTRFLLEYLHINKDKGLRVLDPLCNYGERLIASACSPVDRYIGFTSKSDRIPGYVELIGYAQVNLVNRSNNFITFSNNFEVITLDFECACKDLIDESFDLVTLYADEVIHESSCSLLIIESCRCLQVKGYLLIFISDDSNPSIDSFLCLITQTSTLRFNFSVYLNGVRPGLCVVYQRVYQECIQNHLTDITNPPVRVNTIAWDHSLYHVLDDGELIGGTKQRLLGQLLQYESKREIVYAGTELGLAIVALAYSCQLSNKTAVVFVNSHASHCRIGLSSIAIRLGVVIKYSNRKKGRSLWDTQVAAKIYCDENLNDRLLIPFGMKCPNGHLIHHCLLSSMKQSVRLLQCPKRLWLAAGSGFIVTILHEIWPLTHFLIIQVGKSIPSEILKPIHHTLFIAPERFYENAEFQPQFESVPWYDAKLWRFVVKYGQSDDYIWNVGKVYSDIIK